MSEGLREQIFDQAKDCAKARSLLYEVRKYLQRADGRLEAAGRGHRFLTEQRANGFDALDAELARHVDQLVAASMPDPDAAA